MDSFYPFIAKYMVHKFHRFMGVAFLMLLLSSLSALSQTAEDLIKQGIVLFDKGEYKEAIKLYQQALTLEPNSALANYEISMTYQAVKEYENAFKYSQRAIELDDNQLPAYIIKGSSLDDLGRPKEAVATFEKCLKKFGGHYLVYYNLALTLSRMKDHEGSVNNLLKAIELKSSHASSHLLLANIMRYQERKTESILGYYYFLLLEPGTERSKEAFALLSQELKGNVTVDANDPKHITVGVDPKAGSAQMLMALMQASRETEEVKEKNKHKTQGELFVEDTKMFFDFTGDEKVKKKDRNLWNQLYTPLFKQIANTDHIHAFCYYITKASSEESLKWLNDNKGKLEQFGLWLEKIK